jgi:hypothetical protein
MNNTLTLYFIFKNLYFLAIMYKNIMPIFAIIHICLIYFYSEVLINMKYNYNFRTSIVKYKEKVL